MSETTLDLGARAVLHEFGVSSRELRELGNRGGFSGAALWRVPEQSSDLCLRAWPIGEWDRHRITAIHSLMKLARDKGLSFVPSVLTTQQGSTIVEEGYRLWELTTWMPGAATSPDQATQARVEVACTALALLHHAWADIEPIHAACPGILRRLEALREWDARIRTGRLEFSSNDPAQPWAERAWRVLKIHADKISSKIRPWLGHHLQLQPCLCDIWHDHVLFDGDVVTGLVDYGGIKSDNVAVDLARLLGSMVEDRGYLRMAGLDAYKRIRPISLQEEELVSVLDETGALVGLITWLKWLYLEDKQFDDRTAAARRLQALVERMEKWNFVT